MREATKQSMLHVARKGEKRMIYDPNNPAERPGESTEADNAPTPVAQPAPATDQDILKAMLGKPIFVLGAEPNQRRKAG